MRHLTREQGSATVEIAILGPTLLLLVFTLVQAALWYHARGLALAAAQQGATAGAGYTAGATSAATHARAFLARSGQDTLREVEVSTTGSTATQIHVEVSGRVLSVLPGLPSLRVVQDAESPVERFTLPERAR